MSIESTEALKPRDWVNISQNTIHNLIIQITLGIGVKWQYLQNHVAPVLFYAYRPQNT